MGIYAKRIEFYKNLRDKLETSERRHANLANHYENLMLEKERYYLENFKHDIASHFMYTAGCYVTGKINALERKLDKKNKVR